MGDSGGDNPYVRHGTLRYPKTGTKNPEVTLKVIDMNNLSRGRTHVVEPPQNIVNA